LIVVVVMEGGGSVAVEAFGVSVDTTVWAVFIAGVVTGLLALAGVVALLAEVRRMQARRREIEYLRQKVAEQEGNDPLAAADNAGGGPLADGWNDERQRGRRRAMDLS